MTRCTIRFDRFRAQQLRPARPRLRSVFAATAIALVCLGGWASTTLADDSGSYEVLPGDTIISIADGLGMTPEDLASINQLADPNVLAVGQTLRIVRPFRPPSSLVHLVADKHDEAPGRIETGGSPDLAADSVAPAATKVTIAAPTPAPHPTLPLRPPIIATTYLSQFDGTIWGPDNCGPTSLAIGLSALKIAADPLVLRHYANQEMGFSSPESGTTWESLAYAAKVSGASIKRLYNGKHYRTWTVDDLQAELRQGHPVLLLVRFWNLPDHGTSDYAGDHYIVAVGFDPDGNLVYDDPAFRFTSGDGRTINHAHLMKAWTNTAVGLVRTAMALVATKRS